MSLPERALALAYLRTDISGIRQTWEEIQMRSLAARLGYNLRKTITFSAATEDRIERLLRELERHNAEAVFVPSLDHLEGEVELIKARVDIIVDAVDVEARWPSVADLFCGSDDRVRRVRRWITG